MNDTVINIFLVVAIPVFTITYRLLPFRTWENKKPKFTLFPKYIVKFDKPISEIKAALKRTKFKKTTSNKYIRGRFFGDFSAKAIKLSVVIDEENKQLKIYASFFGILFDTGDVWQVAAELLNEPKP